MPTTTPCPQRPPYRAPLLQHPGPMSPLPPAEPPQAQASCSPSPQGTGPAPLLCTLRTPPAWPLAFQPLLTSPTPQCCPLSPARAPKPLSLNVSSLGGSSCLRTNPSGYQAGSQGTEGRNSDRAWLGQSSAPVQRDQGVFLEHPTTGEAWVLTQACASQSWFTFTQFPFEIRFSNESL